MQCIYKVHKPGQNSTIQRAFNLMQRLNDTDFHVSTVFCVLN